MHARLLVNVVENSHFFVGEAQKLYIRASVIFVELDVPERTVAFFRSLSSLALLGMTAIPR